MSQLGQPKVTATFKRLTIPLDAVEMPRATSIGLIAPFDFALDEECRRWLPAGVPLFITRTPPLGDAAVTIELAKDVSDPGEVKEAVSCLSAVKPAAIAYGCTSGSFVSGVTGEADLCKCIVDAGGQAAVTSSGALVEALNYLGIKRLAVATPYNESLTQALCDFLNEASIEVVSTGYLDKEEGIARINYETVSDLARAVDDPDAEAIFLSCTNLHTFDILSSLEEELGKPVLSGNQVMMWAALRAGNIALPELDQALFLGGLAKTTSAETDTNLSTPAPTN